MDYQKHYDRLIQKARERILEGYSERHHVVPKCLGGSDDKTNLVDLTPEEHYVAHQLLVKMHPENGKLVHAARMMTYCSDGSRVQNKLYGWLKRKSSMESKKRVGDKNGSFGTIWVNDGTNSFKIKKEDFHPGLSKGKISNDQRKIRRSKNKQTKHENAVMLFNKFRELNYTSMGQFIRDGHYPHSLVALTKMWKKYIPEYAEIVQQGKGVCVGNSIGRVPGS